MYIGHVYTAAGYPIILRLSQAYLGGFDALQERHDIAAAAKTVQGGLAPAGIPREEEGRRRRGVCGRGEMQATTTDSTLLLQCYRGTSFWGVKYCILEIYIYFVYIGHIYTSYI